MEERERWWKMGLKAVSEGKLGVLLLSGGQVSFYFSFLFLLLLSLLFLKVCRTILIIYTCLMWVILVLIAFTFWVSDFVMCFKKNYLLIDAV